MIDRLEIEVNVRGEAKRADTVEVFRSYTDGGKEGLKEVLFEEIKSDILRKIEGEDFKKKFDQEFNNKFRFVTRERPEEIPYLKNNR